MTHDYLAFAQDLARQAGAIMLEHFTLGVQRDLKSDNSPVTKADLAINALVIESVKKRYPTHSILAEEGSDIAAEYEFLWVCDPIDGTIAYCHGIPTSVFSLALVHNGVVIMGVVYDPYLDRMFSAQKGKGAFLNDEKIFVSKNTNLSATAMDACYWKGSRYHLGALSEELMEEGVHLMSLGSITYGQVLIACGEFAAVIFAQDQPYDTAAAKVIVEEAGGRVTDFHGNEPVWDAKNDGFLLTNGVLHERLLQMIKKNVKDL